MIMQIKSIRSLLHSERGFTLLEIMVTLVIVCLFAVVITQFMSISFKDLFFKSSQMDSTATAQNLMEKVTAVVESNDDTSLNGALESMKEYVTEENLLIYDSNKPVRFWYERVSDVNVWEDGINKDVNGIDISVVIFFNNGKYHIQKDNFIYRKSS